MIKEVTLFRAGCQGVEQGVAPEPLVVKNLIFFEFYLPDRAFPMVAARETGLYVLPKGESSPGRK